LSELLYAWESIKLAQQPLQRENSSRAVFSPSRRQQSEAEKFHELQLEMSYVEQKVALFTINFFILSDTSYHSELNLLPLY
jgi:hypothetical protein